MHDADPDLERSLPAASYWTGRTAPIPPKCAAGRARRRRQVRHPRLPTVWITGKPERSTGALQSGTSSSQRTAPQSAARTTKRLRRASMAIPVTAKRVGRR